MGSKLCIISEEISINRLTKPSIQILEGICLNVVLVLSVILTLNIDIDKKIQRSSNVDPIPINDGYPINKAMI
jgi:hypothetical protein